MPQPKFAEKIGSGPSAPKGRIYNRPDRRLTKLVDVTTTAGADSVDGKHAVGKAAILTDVFGLFAQTRYFSTSSEAY